MNKAMADAVHAGHVWDVALWEVVIWGESIQLMERLLAALMYREILGSKSIAP